MLAIRLDPDIEKRLEMLAKKTGRSKTFYARQAILEYLQDMEDYYLAVDLVQSPGKRGQTQNVKIFLYFPSPIRF